MKQCWVLVCCLFLSAMPFESQLSEQGEEELCASVARVLNFHLLEPTSEYRHAFIEGVAAGLDGVEADSERFYSMLLAYDSMEFCEKAETNLREANALFQGLAACQDLTCVEGGKLYYKTLVQGDGPRLPSNADRVYLRWARVQSDATPVLTNPMWANMSELVPGLAHGMQGMRVGETRAVYVHPAYGYGSVGNFEPNLALHFHVSLEWIETLGAELSSLEPTPLTTEPSLKVSLQDLAYEEGLIVGQHFSQLSDLLPKSTLVSALEQEDELPDAEMIETFSRLQCLIHYRNSVHSG